MRTKPPAGLLQNRVFMTLFAAQVISQLGSGVTTVGLSLLTYQMAGAAAATAVLGDALMLRILAFLLFSQPAGMLADLWGRKRILVAADLSRCVLLLVFPLVRSAWQLQALVFAVNALTAFFTPAFEASLPEVVGQADYPRALSLSRVAVDVETVAGPAVAGLLAAVLGVRLVFWFDALTYLVSAVLVLGVRLPAPAPGNVRLDLSGRRLLGEATRGVRVLLREPSLRQALLLGLCEATAGAAAIVVTVVYVKDVLGRGTFDFALAMTCVSAGSSGAALFLSRAGARYEQGALGPAGLHERRHRWAASALLVGGGLLALALLPGVLRPGLAFFFVLWFVNGVGQALIAVSSTTLLSEHTFPEERGRAYAAHFALTHACWLLTYPAVGHAAARFSAPVTFTGAGLGCLAVVAAAAALGRGPRGEHLHAQAGATAS